MVKSKDILLLESNELIRSLNSIIEREGYDTDWISLDYRVKKILKEQHEIVNRIRRKEKINKIKKDLENAGKK